MLTFFEYLRQRAFESVVAGVNDAYEYLDSHKSYDNPQLPKPKNRASEQPKLDAQSEPKPSQPAQGDSNSAPAPNSNSTAAKEEQNLPPRKRGRPKNQHGGGR